MGHRLRVPATTALVIAHAMALGVSGATAAGDHLLLCEGQIKGTYTGAQTDFLEIANPTAETVDLSHYFLSDHKHYYRLPAALGGETEPPQYTGGDFTVRFPFGATIGPGETRTVAFDAVAFEAAYGRWPDFEIRRPPDTGHPAVPDLLEAYPGAIEFQPGFTGDGEYVVLFYWVSNDPESDLVKDVDIARLGKPADTNNDVPDKSGIAVDGPDPGATATPYPAQAMTMDQPPTDPGEGKSTKRLLPEGGNESAGGSGLTGDDETSEKIARTWDGEFGYGPPDPGCCTAVGIGCYYEGIASADPDLRAKLNLRIAGHRRFGWGDTLWKILELAEADPWEDDGNETVDSILEIYKNAVVPRVDSGRTYAREHTWPKSLGFPEVTQTPHTDCHALFLADGEYNRRRNNQHYGFCPGACETSPTEETYGQGGPLYPNRDERTYSPAGKWETWIGRRGDVARAQFYMDLRYEPPGTVSEPDLILTNVAGDIVETPDGAVEGKMGLLDDLIQWHLQDPVDDVERARHEIVFFFQKNRNPFIDHPEWLRCLYGGGCPGTGGVAGLSITKSDGEIEIVPGQALTYAIDVANAGPDAVGEAVVQDLFDLTRLEASSIRWSCARLLGVSPWTGCRAIGSAAELAAGVAVALQPGESVRLTVEATTLPSASGALINTASVTPPAGVTDPDARDDSATDQDTFLVPGSCGEFEDRDLSGRTVDTAQTFTACRSIRAGSFAVVPPGVATLRAGISISLDDGVTVDAGCDLLFDLDPALASG